MQNPNSETSTALTVASPELAPKNQNFDLMGLAPLVLVFIVFYFMIFRPQQQKLKMHKNLLERLQRGDRVLTEGGFFGIIHRVINENEIQVELAENVIVKMRRSAVIDILSKPDVQPQSTDADLSKKNKKASSIEGKTKKK